MQEVLGGVLIELHNAWRFRWRALLVAAVVAVLGWLFVYSLPNEYTVKAKVHVDTASILRPLLHGLAVQPDLNQAVMLLAKTVLNRANLEQIAYKSNLDMGGLSKAQKEGLLDSLARSIHITDAGQDLYVVEYSNPKPAVVKAVVQEVLNIMMADAVGTTTKSSISAQKFLNTQVRKYSNKLNEAEQALAKFKRENIGYLPAENGNYFTQLQAARQRRDGLLDHLAIARTQYKALKSQTGPMVQPDSDPLIHAINQRILEDRQNLSALLTQYTGQYPGVQAMQERIRLEKHQRDELVKKFVQNQGRGAEPNSIAYQNLLQQQSEAAVKIQTLKQKLAQARALIGKLKTSAGKSTEVEARLEALTRSYDVTRKQYNELLSRLYSAELSQTAQASGNPLKFQIIDPPVLPVLPSGPKRHLMALMVLFAALAAGAALAYLSSVLKPVFRTRAELVGVLGLPILGYISLATTRAQEQARRISVVGYSVGVLILLVVGFAAVLYANQGAELVRVKLLGGAL